MYCTSLIYNKFVNSPFSFSQLKHMPTWFHAWILEFWSPFSSSASLHCILHPVSRVITSPSNLKLLVYILYIYYHLGRVQVTISGDTAYFSRLTFSTPHLSVYPCPVEPSAITQICHTLSFKSLCMCCLLGLKLLLSNLFFTWLIPMCP